VHDWLFVTALKLHRFFPEKAELGELLAEATANCGRDVPDREIEAAIMNSQSIAEGTAPKVPHRAAWPERNEELINATVRNGPGLEALQASSPMRWNDEDPHTEEIIDALFPGNPLLCAGLRMEKALTRTREKWRGFMAKQQFIVPSPMNKVYGRTKEGRISMRTDENTGPRRFLVVEFDKGEFDQHAAVLAHLGNLAPLVMVVFSGNKSLHGWFFSKDQPEETVLKFFAYAVSLGADPRMWKECQWCRLPDGLRNDNKRQGVRQRVVYYNPAVLEVV